MGEEQLWITQKWHARFGREPDPGETGFGHTTEQAKSFKSPGAKVITDYHQAIFNNFIVYVNNKLNDRDLTREVYTPTLKITRTVEQIIVAELWHTMHMAPRPTPVAMNPPGSFGVLSDIRTVAVFGFPDVVPSSWGS